MELQDFYKEIKEWLLPLNYTEIYSNHPCLPQREFHFIKNGIRVCCVNDNIEEYYYITSIRWTHPEIMIVQSGRYSLSNKTKLDSLIKTINKITIIEDDN